MEHLFSLMKSRAERIAALRLIAAVFLLSIGFKGVNAIDCYKCMSMNGNNPACDDPFHNNYTESIYERHCMAGRKHRNGVFPATACVKLTGFYVGTDNERLTVRACALDSGSLTIDTELIRVSHCGSFYFDDRYVRGCVQTCDEYDGCNGASSLGYHWTILILIISLIAYHT